MHYQDPETPSGDRLQELPFILDCNLLFLVQQWEL